MEKFKKVLLSLTPYAVGFTIGLLFIRFGATTGETVGEYEDVRRLFYILLPLLVLLVSLLVGLLLHIIIHEAGHLAAGRLSGYSFVSLRVGNLTIIREEDKLVRKKYGIAGASGQCLMSPPDVADTQHKFPFIFYNLGGGLANILFSIPLLIFSFLASGHILSALLIFALIGIILGVVNIIPMKISGIANDGLNIITCCKSLKNRRALWIQLKFVALVTQGVRLCDMPQEWVEDIGVPTDALTGFLASLRCCYLLEKGEIEQARDYAKSVIENPGKMLELHKSELRCELLFCELIGECRASEIEKLYTAKLRKHIKAHATHLPKHRLIFAYERLYAKDEAKAYKALTNFERACLHTPFKGEIAGERELVELVKQTAELKRGIQCHPQNQDST